GGGAGGGGGGGYPAGPRSIKKKNKKKTSFLTLRRMGGKQCAPARRPRPPPCAAAFLISWNACAPIRCHAFFSFFQAEDGIRNLYVTGVQTCALPISFDDLNDFYDPQFKRRNLREIQ